MFKFLMDEKICGGRAGGLVDPPIGGVLLRATFRPIHEIAPWQPIDPGKPFYKFD